MLALFLLLDAGGSISFTWILSDWNIKMSAEGRSLASDNFPAPKEPATSKAANEAAEERRLLKKGYAAFTSEVPAEIEQQAAALWAKMIKSAKKTV